MQNADISLVGYQGRSSLHTWGQICFRSQPIHGKQFSSTWVWDQCVWTRWNQPHSPPINTPQPSFFAVYFVIGAFLGSLALFSASSLRSILFPTKIFGALGTHSSNSGNHCIRVDVPFSLHSRMMEDQQLKMRWGIHRNEDMLRVAVYYIILVLLYPYITHKKYHSPRFTIFPSTFKVVAKLSNTVGS